MFETPGTNVSSVHITEEVVSGKTSPKYVRSSSSSSDLHDIYDGTDSSGSVDQERAINT
jgi:hypothetical protein